MHIRRIGPLGLGIVLALAALLPLSGARTRAPIPPLVFVQRQSVPGIPVVPGMGPLGRARVTGGRLMVRAGDGTFHELLAGRFYDFSGPAVSYDARWLAFAAVTARDSAWRLWRCDPYGRQLAQVTHTDRALDLSSFGAAAKRFARYDDLDPCWLPDGRIVFASTRWPWLAEEGGQPATNLWVVAANGSGLARLTSERNGAEKPSVDPLTGRIVYARWFTNRFRAGTGASGLTTLESDAMPADTVDLWQAISIDPDGGAPRWQGGDPGARGGQMAYSPITLGDGSLLATTAEHGSLTRTSRFGLQRLWPAGNGPFGEARPVIGFGAPEGWSACMPALLPDGRLVFSMDREGTGDFDLYVTAADGADPIPLEVESSTLELSPAVLAPRPLPPVLSAAPGPALAALPPTTLAEALASGTMRYTCRNVFASGPVDGRWLDPVAPQVGARVRFYAALARPAELAGDTLVLVAEAAVSARGVMRAEGLPARTPLFLQLVDASGRVLRAGSGPAHMPGFDSSPPNAERTCIGCHAGHSALPVPADDEAASWSNLAPLASVTASSARFDGDGPVAAIDRKTGGDPLHTAWLTDSTAGQWLRLEWKQPIELKAVVLHALRQSPHDGGLVRIRGGELVLFANGHDVQHLAIDRELSAEGTTFECAPRVVDALEFRPAQVNGRFRGKPVLALAEIEALARVPAE